MMNRVGTRRIAAFNAAAMTTARRSLGWSQGRLAAQLGVSIGTMSSWERGRRAPDAPTIQHIAAALDLPTAALLDGTADTWTLIEWRVLAGLHQKSAAEEIGVHSTTLSRIELGYEKLNDHIASALAELYDTEPATIHTAWQNGRDQLTST